MASFIISYMPNPIMSSATFVADTIPLPYSSKQDHTSFLKSNVSFHDQMVSKLGDPITTARSPTSTAGTLSSVWREIQGSNNWDNLIDPLDPLLQSEIIRYGEFVTVCYKAFDLDPNSKRYLTCKYGKKTMLKEVGLTNSGYEVTKYIYATPPNITIPIQPGSGSNARWVGYVAVSEDDDVIKRIGRRDILITFRGTVTNPEWVANLMSLLTSAQLDPHDPRPDVKVESGFLSLYTSNESGTKFGVGSCRDQLLSEVSRLINKYKGEKLSITLAGHSMGSSLALLLAYDICELGLNNLKDENIPVTVFSFAGPRVGNLGFKERCEALGVKVLRIVNVNDPITKLPGVLFNESFRVFPWSYCSCYTHVGVELLLDFFKVRNPSCVHDLESYIGLLKKTCKKVEKVESVGLVEWANGFVLRSCTLSQLDGVLWENAAWSVMNLFLFMCL